jgi:hypothetical protein
VIYERPLKRYQVIPIAASDPRTVAVMLLVKAMMIEFLKASHREGLSKIRVLYQISEACSHCIPFAELKEKNVTTKSGTKRKRIVRTSIVSEKEARFFLE